MQFAAMYMSDDSNRSFFLDSYTNADEYKKAVDKLNPTFGVDTRLNDAIKVCDSLISSLSEKCFFGALKSDSTHHFFRNACTKSGSLRFSQFSGC
jgi:hypothetical protein